MLWTSTSLDFHQPRHEILIHFHHRFSEACIPHLVPFLYHDPGSSTPQSKDAELTSRMLSVKTWAVSAMYPTPPIYASLLSSAPCLSFHQVSSRLLVTDPGPSEGPGCTCDGDSRTAMTRCSPCSPPSERVCVTRCPWSSKYSESTHGGVHAGCSVDLVLLPWFLPEQRRR